LSIYGTQVNTILFFVLSTLTNAMIIPNAPEVPISK
jgi:hypothetical protein